MLNWMYNLFKCKSCELLEKELEYFKERLREIEYKECESCGILKTQIEIEQFEKRELLNKTLFKPEPSVPQVREEEFKPVMPRHTPWSIRQRILENEDREKARILKELAEQEQPIKTVIELEKELLVAKDVSSNSGGATFNKEELTEEEFEKILDDIH